MEIAVTKKQKFGEGAIVEIVIDKAYSWNSVTQFDCFSNGLVSEQKFIFSRKFTNTINENGHGVFDFSKNDCTIQFDRPNGAIVAMRYKPIEFNKLSANEILTILVDRINSVNAAFATKYPSIDEIAVVDLPTY